MSLTVPAAAAWIDGATQRLTGGDFPTVSALAVARTRSTASFGGVGVLRDRVHSSRPRSDYLRLLILISDPRVASVWSDTSCLCRSGVAGAARPGAGDSLRCGELGDPVGRPWFTWPHGRVRWFLSASCSRTVSLLSPSCLP